MKKQEVRYLRNIDFQAEDQIFNNVGKEGRRKRERGGGRKDGRKSFSIRMFVWERVSLGLRKVGEIKGRERGTGGKGVLS